MFTDIAYTSGVRSAIASLGLKTAASVASTIIPKATPQASQISKGIRALQSADTSLVAPSVLHENPLRHYLAVIGEVKPMESQTSRAFRSEIQSQIDPKELMSNFQGAKVPTPISEVSELATVPPPRMRAA